MIEHMRYNIAETFLFALKGGTESVGIFPNGADIEHENDLVIFAS
jgi:hypothetical protein